MMKRSLKLFALIMIASLTLACGNIEEQAAKDMEKIENQVALDAVEQYKIAKRSGTAMDAYTSAGLAAAAFLQANDEENYKKWKKIEQEEAKALGL